MFVIEIKTGDAGPVTLRGCSDGTVEMCGWKEAKQDDGTYKSSLIAFKWFASIEQAFNRVARMRVSSYDAKNIADLVKGVKAIREDINREMGVLL